MAENNEHTTGMLKNEYARLIGIPVSTLRNYMNNLYFTELVILGYYTTQKYLTPKQINFLNSKLVIVSD